MNSACPDAREGFTADRWPSHARRVTWKTALIEMVNDGRCPFCGRVMIDVTLAKGASGLSWACAGYKP